MSYSTIKVNSVTGGLTLNGGNYSNKINVQTQKVDASMDPNQIDNQDKSIPFSNIDLFYWVDNEYVKKILSGIEKKGVSIGFSQLAVLAENYGDDFIKVAAKKLAPIMATATGCATTGGGLFSTVVNTGKEALVKLLPLDKAITSLYTNTAEKQLANIAEKYAAQEVKRGVISAAEQSTRAQILKEGGLERVAGGTSEAYAITGAGMVANGVKNGVFYFACGSLISIGKHWYQTGSFTEGVKEFWENDAGKLAAEATGATIGYIAGSAIGATIGGLIGGPAGAYLGQKIGCFVGQLAGSIIGGWIYEHKDEIYHIGAQVVHEISGFVEYVADGLADLAKSAGTHVYNFSKSLIHGGGEVLSLIWPW